MALLGEIAETILVTSIVLFFIVSLLHFFRNRARPSPPIVVSTESVFIRQENGSVIELTGHQRRAVLEAIFSDAAKAITDQDVKPKRKKKRTESRTNDQDNAPVPSVEIPSSTQQLVHPYSNEEKEDRDIEEGTSEEEEEDVIIHLSPDHEAVCSVIEETNPHLGDCAHAVNKESAGAIRSILRPASSVQENEEEEHQNMHVISTVLSEETAPVENTNNTWHDDGNDDIDMSSVSYEPHGVLLGHTVRSLDGASSYPGTFVREVNTDRDNEKVAAGIEGDLESEGGDQCEIPNPLIRSALSIVSQESSFATVTSEYTFDDDSTAENLCSICLCGYSAGDVLIVSKHCSHIFHKDCILSWLDQHDDCPVCREGMVTDSEVDQAVRNVVKPSLTRQQTPVTTNTTAAATPPRGPRPSLSHSMVSSPIRHLPPRVVPQRRLR